MSIQIGQIDKRISTLEDTIIGLNAIRQAAAANECYFLEHLVSMAVAEAVRLMEEETDIKVIVAPRGGNN